MLTIYKITDISNGKIYIGSTMRSFESRFQSHKLIRGGGNRGLCEWYPDIDPSNLIGEILEEIPNPSVEEIKYRTKESFYIQKYLSMGFQLYNKRSGAFEHSTETKNRISDSMRGRTIPTEVKAKISASTKGVINLDNRSAKHHRILYNGSIYEGSRELMAQLQLEGYELTYHQVNNLVASGFFSKKNCDKYPELLHSLVVIK